jgi:hypothetical protein
MSPSGSHTLKGVGEVETGEGLVQPMRKRMPARLAGLVFALALPLGQFAVAQNLPSQEPYGASEVATQPPGESATVPAPTPLAEIAHKTEEAEEELAEIQGSLAPAPVVEAIAEQQVTLDEPLAEGKRVVETERLSQLSLRDLRDLQQRWEEWQLRVEGWESQVESRAQELESARDRLATMKSEWEETRESVGEVEIPPELSDRIALVVAKHEETTGLVDARLSRLPSTSFSATSGRSWPSVADRSSSATRHRCGNRC